MFLFPAIDLYDHKAVRLYKGDYAQMTVYSDHPTEIAQDFIKSGAEHIHIVDLAGARDGSSYEFDTVKEIKKTTGAFCEIGGGIRSLDSVEKYISCGLDRVILGTAALKDSDFLQKCIDRFGDKIAVGVDLKDGFVAVKGWTEKTSVSGLDFCKEMVQKGVQTLICTDISKDGVMKGTNRELYRLLSSELPVNIIASGGVSSIDDIQSLSKMGLYGCIIGKAYYTGAIDLKEAVTLCGSQKETIQD